MPAAPSIQPAVLEPLPAVARSLTFRIHDPASIRAALDRLASDVSLDCAIVGIGEPCALALRVAVPGLRTFPALSGPGCAVPSSQDALWMRLGGPDRGIVFDAARSVRAMLADAFRVSHTLDTFVYRGGRDLTRFEDGTENPKGADAVDVTAVAGGPMAGSTFVAVQQWVHDLGRFDSFSDTERDNVIGRSAQTNDELDDAPRSAHVKRSAQESFEPTAFMVRRSMPWAGADDEGLEFVAFANTLDAFERVMRRMAGLEDGIVDGLFRFSRPVTGGYYWCPPMVDGRLALGVLFDDRRNAR